MGHLYSFKNGVESLLTLPKLLIADGDLVSPRGQQTRELRNVLITIDDPTDPTMTDIGRKWSRAIATAEFLQLAGGFSDPDMMELISPTFAKFKNGGALHGAYGPRLSMQMQPVIDRLLDDPLTRQAIAVIWDPLHDVMQEGRKDLPCTLSLTFAIRDNKLLMSTHMRSNDVWWGWSYDLFQFTQLQCTVANFLGIEPGLYTHYADSFHLYTRDEDAALAVTIEDSKPRAILQGIGRSEEYGSWRDVQQLAYDLFYADNTTDDMTVTEEWLAEVMIRARRNAATA